MCTDSDYKKLDLVFTAEAVICPQLWYFLQDDFM